MELVEFDYRELCAALWAQSDARFEIAKIEGRSGETVHTDRGDVTAPLIVDALGWRRVLGSRRQRPAARGPDLPRAGGAPAAGGTDLDVLDRPLRGPLRLRLVGARERRAAVGVGSYEPRHHVKEPTRRWRTGSTSAEAVRYQGN